MKIYLYNSQLVIKVWKEWREKDSRYLVLAKDSKFIFYQSKDDILSPSRKMVCSRIFYQRQWIMLKTKKIMVWLWWWYDGNDYHDSYDDNNDETMVLMMSAIKMSCG
jgi:hypothetical protein